MKLTDAERDTILAALRLWQKANYDVSDELMDIATNGDDHLPMSLEEIDDLCERINT